MAASASTVDTSVLQHVSQRPDEGYCSICLEPYDEGELLGHSTPQVNVNHVFHKACTERLIEHARFCRNHSRCPDCRQVIHMPEAPPEAPSMLYSAGVKIAETGCRAIGVGVFVAMVNLGLGISVFETVFRR